MVIVKFSAVVEMEVDIPSTDLVDNYSKNFQDMPVGAVLKGKIIIKRGEF